MLNLQSECARLDKLNLFAYLFKNISRFLQEGFSYFCPLSVKIDVWHLAHKYMLLDICSIKLLSFPSKLCSHYVLNLFLISGGKAAVIQIFDGLIFKYSK